MRSQHITVRLEELETRLALSGNVGTLPTTLDRVHLFSDQLANRLSDSLVKFIASHFDGVQKMTSSENARYAKVNSNWFLLNYRLATASGPADYIINDSWGSDWSDVTKHEDWFMHNGDGDRLHNETWDWYLHDISNADYQKYFIDSTIADMRATGAQGLFGDSFEAGIGDGWFAQYDPRFAGTNAGNPEAWPGGVTWLDQLHDFAGAVQGAFHAVPESFLFMPNVDALVTSWAKQDFTNVDGVFMEGFGDWGGVYYGAPSDWTLSMNRAISLASADKVLIMQPSLWDTPDSATGQLQREYLVGTYLLLQGDYTFLNIISPDQGSSTSYFPEYDVALGSPLSALPTNVSKYQWNGVYRRDFQNGIVLVNPGTDDITVNLGADYKLVTGSGGGALDDKSLDSLGHYIGGKLSYQTLHTITVHAGGAAILLDTTPSAPTGLTHGTATSSQINLAWQAVANAAGYKVEHSLDGVTWIQVGAPAAGVTTYTDTGLSAATTYYYEVLATNGAGDSSPSKVVSAATAALGNSAAFVQLDTTTQGNWQGTYGADGYSIASVLPAYPSYATVKTSGTSVKIWDALTTDQRALQNPRGTENIASAWYAADSFSIDVNLTDGQTHQVALYQLDWDNGGRSERIDILDATTGALLDTETTSSFAGGQYLVWNLSGHVIIRVTNLSGDNAVVSGLFFG
jgi:hypothetical protein